MDTGTTTPIQPEGVPPQMPPKENHAGALISAGLIVVLLALGAFYFSTKSDLMQGDADDEAALDMNASTTDAETEALRTTSDSDAASDIEADLQATDLGDIEGEMNATSNGI